MENKQLSTQREIFNRSPLNEIKLAQGGLKLGECSDEELKQIIRYAIILLGLPSDKIPTDDLSKGVLLSTLKKMFPMVYLSELRQAFEYAIENRLNIKLDLFGAMFSVKYVADILNAYLKYKKNLLDKTPKEILPSITQQGQFIFSVLQKHYPEFLQELENMGTGHKKPTPKNELPAIQNNDFHQRWMKQFDELRKRTGSNVIYRYGETMDLDRFFSKKMEQLELVKSRKI